MRSRYTCYFCLLVVLVAVASTLLGNDVSGRTAGYAYYVKGKSGEVKEIVFDGDAEWLAAQEDAKSHFHDFPSLRRLTLVRHTVSVEEMKYIATLSNVIALDVGNVTWGLEEDEVKVSGDAIAQIGQMTWLEELEVSGSGFEEKDWSFLPKCKSLRVLRIGPNVTITDVFFQHVAEVRSLEVLDLRGTDDSFSDGALARLSALQRLKELRFSSPHITDNGIDSLARLSDLETLWAFGNVTARSLEHLRPLQKLRGLAIGVEHVSTTEMKVVAQFKNLELLDLSRAEIGDDQVAVLRGHPSLKKLYLTSADVTDSSLGIFESLKNLEHVSLGRDDRSRRIEDAAHDRIRERRRDNPVEETK